MQINYLSLCNIINSISFQGYFIPLSWDLKKKKQKKIEHSEWYLGVHWTYGGLFVCDVPELCHISKKNFLSLPISRNISRFLKEFWFSKTGLVRVVTPSPRNVHIASRWQRTPLVKKDCHCGKKCMSQPLEVGTLDFKWQENWRSFLGFEIFDQFWDLFW